MHTELAMLAASSVLCALLFVPYTLALVVTGGVSESVGNRTEPIPLPEWANRARRAHQNMVENLPHFAALVLIAVLASRTSSATELGATIFFWARLSHAGLYILGVPWLRTIAFLAGLGGEGLILAELI